MTGSRRDGPRTREALLLAAEQMLDTNGPVFTLDAVALAVGVSKGGLLHHFRSRDALLEALVVERLARFVEAVSHHLDPADDRPGRVCRAHIRATYSEDPMFNGLRLGRSVQTALIAVPEVLGRIRNETQRWQQDMAADGLHPQRALLISRALDGEAVVGLFGEVDQQSRREMRDLLLEMSEGVGPLAS